ncbi:TIR domain-containing protein [Sphingobacterium psychroaquaticum]|uniref:TIR domain-containing protein n=1 Tax=Sphingobacterium psychroaquaticum TaxID=561061 RepID=A0A1X7IF83_9SPHI|nr:toll/interleukin-1 receptor domain-containing protein [Sphingobacterium psychroaquaticum]SMG12895.1 TIR domain-containing protein [Sphingobacterium psychroaquaticum]
MEEKKQEKQIDSNKYSKSESPFVFISHDTRDAEIAEAFSKLLKSVSAGMLKSFRSSDNKGTQGIEFGIEWYPKIIESLQDSSDVVCLLTDFSIDRPWILFEAGMAKGKLNTPILGIAIGVPLTSVSTGPFAQFQNCDDDNSSLTKLVKQLVRKLPNSEPDEDVIKQQVEIFKIKTQNIIAKRLEKTQNNEETKPLDNNESARLFEEVKLMFKELPTRIENVSTKRTINSRRHLHPAMVEELIHYSLSRQIDTKYILQIVLAPFRIDFPWIYDSGLALIDKITKVKDFKSTKAFREFVELLDFTLDTPIFRESFRDEYEYRYFREVPYVVESFFKEIEYRKVQSGDENL